MNGLRKVSGAGLSPLAPCVRCLSTGCPWDRIGATPVCPDCQEKLAEGEGEPLVERLIHQTCAVCGNLGTVPYLTYPLHVREPLALDLCPQHFHQFMARRLDRSAYRSLVKSLHASGLSVKQIFLLHEAFYDERGHPIQPVREP